MKHVYCAMLLACVLALVGVQPAFAQDGPLVWTQNLSNGGRVYAMVIDPTNPANIYSAGLDSGVFKTTNGGVSWSAANNGLTYRAVQALAISRSNPSVLYAGTDQNGAANSGVYVSTNGGASWTLSITGITDVKAIQSLAVDPTNPNTAFVATFDGVNASTVGIFKTTDRGANWFPDSAGLTNKNILSLAINPLNPNVVYAGSSLVLPGSTGPSRMFKSTNGGANWVDISNGLPTGTTTGDPVRAISISTVDTALVLAALFLNDTSGGAYVTTNGGASWTKKQGGLPNITGTLLRSCLIKPGSTNEFYVGLDRATGLDIGVRRTTDGGNTWTDFSGGTMLVTYAIRALVFRTTGDPTLYAGVASATPVAARGVHEYSWPAPLINRALLLPTPGVNTNYVQIPFQASMVGFGNNITIEAWVKPGGSTTANTVLNKGAISFDYQLGVNATTTNPFFRAGATIVLGSSVTITPGVWTHLAVTYDGTTVRFYKDGVLAFSQASVLTLGSSTNEMRIGRGNADAGSGNLEELRLWSVARTQGQIDSTKCKKYPGEFASTAGLKALWHFDSTYVDSVSNYNGTPLGNVSFENATLPCGPVGVTENGPDVPSDYQLAQNFPNPFNPTTTLRYSLPKDSYVTMKIFNVLGQEVITLRDELQRIGSYDVQWNGRNELGAQVASGLYFYRVDARAVDGSASFTSIRKMLMLK